MELGERLYQLRRERRMSQEALADALGVSRQSVSKWENGASTPDLDKLVRLGELFGLSLDELVKGQAPPTAEGDGGGRPPPCSKGRMIAAVVLLVCGGLAALLLFATTLLYFAVWLLLAGVLCLRAREHLGILLGGTAWLFALLFSRLVPFFLPGISFPPQPTGSTRPFICCWTGWPFFLFCCCSAWPSGPPGGGSTGAVSCGLGWRRPCFSPPELYAACSITVCWHPVFWSWILDFTFPGLISSPKPLCFWPCSLSPSAVTVAVPFVVLAGWVLSFGLDRLAAAAFPYSTFLYYYWPLLLLLFYLALAWAGAAWERRRPPQA
ncbi:helix-turn-helix domain-containing protein [Flavonifractor plautii]|nr:helix-turn-helix domain-containing protein [Flavonifractor plautii]